jgi:hypothetical protein
MHYQHHGRPIAEPCLRERVRYGKRRGPHGHTRQHVDEMMTADRRRRDAKHDLYIEGGNCDPARQRGEGVGEQHRGGRMIGRKLDDALHLADSQGCQRSGSDGHELLEGSMRDSARWLRAICSPDLAGATPKT